MQGRRCNFSSQAKRSTIGQPLAGKDVALAYLNYTIGSLTLQKDPSNALKILIKAAQFETPLKKSPYTYAYIAGAYETGPYAKLSEEYKRLYKDKDETPESKLALANINQIVDRMIDAYARAVALAGTDAKFAAQKTGLAGESDHLVQVSGMPIRPTGMNELVAGIFAKPLPPEPTPLTSLPARLLRHRPTSTRDTRYTAPAPTAPAGTPSTKQARLRRPQRRQRSLARRSPIAHAIVVNNCHEKAQ